MHTENDLFLFVICCVMFTLFSDHSSGASRFKMIISIPKKQVLMEGKQRQSATELESKPIQLCIPNSLTLYVMQHCVVFILETCYLIKLENCSLNMNLFEAHCAPPPFLGI